MCFFTTFEFIFETRLISLVNFCLLKLTLPFGGIYIVIKLVPAERDCCWDKRRIIYNLPYIYILYVFGPEKIDPNIIVQKLGNTLYAAICEYIIKANSTK